MTMDEPIRIGNAGGYWGDDLTVLRRQIEGGPIDVVTMDFLAEITMSILQKQLSRNPEAGYARDFIDQMREVMTVAIERNVMVIANSGGVRPHSCAEALMGVATELGVKPCIGVVSGDDILQQAEDWHADGLDMSNLDDGRPFDEISGRLVSANAYFGAEPVARVISEGALFVITGRVTDTGLTLGPMIHRFGWEPADYDKIAAGIVAGHILECGAQSTGGNFSNWREVPSFHDIGYPIVEIYDDGEFVVTKHEHTGGLVSVETVKEQLVYEMGDPTQYLTPDAIVDFTSIRLDDDGENRVRVSGIRGAPPTDLLKVSMSYQDGFKASGSVIVCGPDARAKSEVFRDILWARLPEFDNSHTEYIGDDSTWGPLSPADEPSEIMLRFGVHDQDSEKVREFSKMLPALILSGPPGVAVTGGRPATQDVVAYWPCLIPRSKCRARIDLLNGTGSTPQTVDFNVPVNSQIPPSTGPAQEFPEVRAVGETVVVKLRDIAHGRSGDKGDTCNVGVVARHPALYPWMVDHLTAGRVKEAFGSKVRGAVERFEIPNLGALNFLLHESLGGGGTLSLHIDAQGKTYSHALLNLDIEIDRAYLEAVEGVSSLEPGR